MTSQNRLLALAAFSIAALSPLTAGQTTWNFSDSANPLDASSGNSTLTYYDPIATDWGPASTTFDTASNLGLPLINGTDVEVMSFPGCAPDQGYLVTHDFTANGSYESLGLVSNYTVVMDVLFPSSSDGQWRSLVQTDTTNATDGEFFVQNQFSGGIGINGNYRGTILPDTWHRIVWVMRSAPGEGQAHRYIDGQFVGAIGTTGSGLDERWALGSDLLLFADENNDTAPGYLSSISIVDRKLSYAEVIALGGPSPDGADSPGPPAGPYTDLMSRPVKTLGHRGSSGCAPENTLAAIEQAFLEGAAGTEIDTRITSDGVVIAFHDGTVDRTTDGTGNVIEMTLAEIKELDAGSWFGPDFVGEKVPTLTEVLTASKGKGIIYLDIKTDGQADGFAEAVTASDFPLADLWFWTPGDRAYAAEIRAAIPGAQIVWGNPGSTWQTDPDFFTDLRDLGVIGFSYGQGGADLAFSARAKQEGFFVEVFTVLDLEQYRAAALAGVDFIETDFPNVMEAMQPAQAAAASGPQPPDGTSNLRNSLILAWIPGQNATSHRIHFGTSNPPEFLVEQDHDLFQTTDLLPDTTYYCRIDEVTPDGTETGPVWTYTTLPAPPTAIAQEWHLNGDLESASGDSLLTFAGDSEDAVTFEESDGGNIPHMANGPTKFLRIPAFIDPSRGLDLTFPTIAANGGGQNINNYSFVFDIFVPGALDWLPFFNTNPENTNDSDFFGRANGGLGIAALGYAADGTISPGVWQRIIFSADLTTGTVTYYVNGTLVSQRTGASLIDGRFALFGSTNNLGPHVRLLNDNDGETTEVLVGAIAFLDQPIDDATAAELGAPDANGIFITNSAPPVLTVSLDSSPGNVTLTWPAQSAELYKAQTSTDLATWTDLSTNPTINDEQATLQVPVSSLENSPAHFFRLISQ